MKDDVYNSISLVLFVISIAISTGIEDRVLTIQTAMLETRKLRSLVESVLLKFLTLLQLDLRRRQIAYWLLHILIKLQQRNSGTRNCCK